jgi:hypothetical protein
MERRMARLQEESFMKGMIAISLALVVVVLAACSGSAPRKVARGLRPCPYHDNQGVDSLRTPCKKNGVRWYRAN